MFRYQLKFDSYCLSFHRLLSLLKEPVFTANILIFLR